MRGLGVEEIFSIFVCSHSLVLSYPYSPHCRFPSESKAEMDEKPAILTPVLPAVHSPSSIPAGVLSNVKPLTQLTVDVSSSSSSSSPQPRDEKPGLSSTSGIGEKRKLEVDVSALAMTTATADTPPATLEPPDAKMRKAEGQ